MSPRSMSPLDRSIEEKLVATLEAVDGALPRSEIFARVCDDFESEEHLAKSLGRLVASGALYRQKRVRPGAGEEFVYSTKPDARMAAIAAAAQKAEPIPTTAAPPAAQEPAMPKTRSHDAAAYVELLTNEGRWMGPKEIFKQLGAGRGTALTTLRDLANAKRIQVAGSMRSLRYAALGVPVAGDGSGAKNAELAPAKGGEAAPKEKKKTGSRKAKTSRPARNLADFGAPQKPQLPVPVRAVAAGELAWAIDDKGVVAINDGTHTIKLKPADIEYGVGFLERTQLIWKSAA
jgi:hypothetical protein